MLPKIGHREHLEKEIAQYRKILNEVTGTVDTLVLELTHRTDMDFVQRQRKANELKGERSRVKYFERRIVDYTSKLERVIFEEKRLTTT